MSDDDQAFAAELASLRPRRPSPELISRIEDSLAAQSGSQAVGQSGRPNRPTARPSDRPTARSWAPVTWLAFGGLAAAFAFSTIGRLPPDILLPTGTASTVYAADDEGVVRLADGTPARRTRIRSIETTTWRNPRTKASLQMSQPSEEIHDEPLTFN